MANPLLLLLSQSRYRRRRGRLPVPVPYETPTSDAIFVMLRRLRKPLVVLVMILAGASVGLSQIPGTDGRRLTLFESFYFMTYTAATIGYGEIVQLSTAQRMWTTLAIYVTVLGWAYAIGTALTLLQDPTVRDAFATHRFARHVRGLREEFIIVVGYGKTGRQVVLGLDAHGRRVVVVDEDENAINRLETESLFADVPGLSADGGMPGVLGLAGLGSPLCAGVLALTNDDDTNLAVVMAASLLRDEVPVIARAHHRVTAERMRAFDTGAVIEPSDKFGSYLMLAMQRPATYELVTTLMADERPTTTLVPHIPTDGRWVVAGEGPFTDEVCRDLRAAGLEVDVVDPRRDHPDVSGAVGFIAGSDTDTVNVALAEQARDDNPDLFVAVRQHSYAYRALLEAMQVDAVYCASDLMANEVLGRMVTPLLWEFVEYAIQQDEAWASGLNRRLRACWGDQARMRRAFTLDRSGAPAAVRWMQHSPLTVGDLGKHPEDRDSPLGAVVLMIIRSNERIFAPEDEVALKRNDRLLVAGTRRALDEQCQILDYDSAVEYVSTGRSVPDGWLWRRLTRSRGRSDAHTESLRRR